ncbi:MAG: DUF1295 domain-containing protein [Phycisphaerales bacterium]
MDVLSQLLWITGAAIGLMFVLWLIHLPLKDAGLVDVGWSFALGAAAVFCALTGEGDETRRWIVGVLGGVWGFRLAYHLLTDRVIGAEHEDGRYLMMREKLGEKAWIVFLGFFEIQALLVGILALPFALAASAVEPVGALDVLAIVIWVTGIVGEAIADWQLRHFKKDPESKGRVCKRGLWRYSRHPNYFFEWLMWVAYATIALPAEWGWLAISAPALMLLLVLKVSGIPPTEARAARSRGAEYRAYQRTTSAFVPWPPKEEAK